MGETFGMLPKAAHYQVSVTTIAKKYNMPGLFYLDLWPASCGQVIVTDPDVALHMTAVRNHPKHPLIATFLDPIIGKGNIVASDGPRWKGLHKMLSPAFAISHIGNLRPMVASEVMKFRSLLHKKAESGEVFKLEELTHHMTFDVISTATFGHSLDAQTKGSPALQHFEDTCRAEMRSRETSNVVRKFFAHRQRDAARRKLDETIASLVRERCEVVRRKLKFAPRSQVFVQRCEGCGTLQALLLTLRQTKVTS